MFKPHSLASSLVWPLTLLLRSASGRRRGTGRWVTDVTHYKPMLSTSTCTFTLQAAGWAGPWVPTLRLRLAPRRGPARRRPLAQQLVPLPFSGGVWKNASDYNSKFKPFVFPTPPRLQKAYIVSQVRRRGAQKFAQQGTGAGPAGHLSGPSRARTHLQGGSSPCPAQPCCALFNRASSGALRHLPWARYRCPYPPRLGGGAECRSSVVQRGQEAHSSRPHARR